MQNVQSVQETRPSVLAPAEAMALGRCQRCPNPAPGLVVGRLDSRGFGWERLVLCPQCREFGRLAGAMLLEVIDGGRADGSDVSRPDLGRVRRRASEIARERGLPS